MVAVIPKHVDVIVVGAGLSGFQAETDCQAAGLSVLVLEAIAFVKLEQISMLE